MSDNQPLTCAVCGKMIYGTSISWIIGVGACCVDCAATAAVPASKETQGARQLCGPGGCAYGLCEKHGVPLISTITEQTYCAVCEAWRAEQFRFLAYAYPPSETSPDGQTWKQLYEMTKVISDKRDEHLREASCCPPDCDLLTWAKRLGDFWFELEGGQVAEQLKQQLALANARCAAMREAMVFVAGELYDDSDEAQKADYLADAIALHKLGDRLYSTADIDDADVEQVAKDHRAMEAVRTGKAHFLGVTGLTSDADKFCAAQWSQGIVYAADPADAILAAEAAEKKESQ